MDIYQLDCTLHESEESEGWMYLGGGPGPAGLHGSGVYP